MTTDPDMNARICELLREVKGSAADIATKRYAAARIEELEMQNDVLKNFMQFAIAQKEAAEKQLCESDAFRVDAERQLADAKADSERLDWCDKHLIALVDGGGAWGIEYGSVAQPDKLDMLPTLRAAIDSARALRP